MYLHTRQVDITTEAKQMMMRSIHRAERLTVVVVDEAESRKWVDAGVQLSQVGLAASVSTSIVVGR
jgi:phenylpyruvate tautomerase PptA (4-oxalocrotonate tautomerase family)